MDSYMWVLEKLSLFFLNEMFLAQVRAEIFHTYSRKSRLD